MQKSAGKISNSDKILSFSFWKNHN